MRYVTAKGNKKLKNPRTKQFRNADKLIVKQSEGRIMEKILRIPV